MARRFASRVALAGALLFPTAAFAQTLVPWPIQGSPLCSAPGDQFSVTATGLVGFVTWFGHASAADTLHLGGAGSLPPSGECLGEASPVTSGVAPGTIAMNLMHTGLFLGCPGCGEGMDLGHAWISHDPGADRVGIHVRNWIWTSPTVIVREAAPATLASPGVTANGTGSPLDTDALVVWAEGTQVRAQRVNQNGALEWNTPDGVLISATGAEPSVQRLDPFSYNEGSALIVWQDHRGPTTDIYALRMLPSGIPAPGWPAGGLALEDRSENSGRPRLVDATNNTFYVVWEESGARFGGGKSIVARKLLVTGLPDPAWPDSGIVVTSSPTVDHLEDTWAGLTSYEWGNLTVLWSDVRDAGPGNPNDLYAQKLLPDGTRVTGWPASGAAVSMAPGSQDHARVWDSMFAWEDTRSGVANVYVTRLDSQGDLPCCHWLPDGNRAALAAGEQRNPIVSGPFVGQGSFALVYWEDGRDLATNGTDIYVQVFQADGSNVTVVGVDDHQLPPVIALREPYPNPTSGTTHVRLDLPRAANVSVAIYDLLGRHVCTIAEGSFGAGLYVWDWRGTNDAGSHVAAGLYRVRALVDGVAQARSVVRTR